MKNARKKWIFRKKKWFEIVETIETNGEKLYYFSLLIGFVCDVCDKRYNFFYSFRVSFLVKVFVYG